jgi:glycosyltransferase involved in cell wall biosynthesis
VTSSAWSRDRLVDDGFDASAIHIVSCGVSREIFRPLQPQQRAQRRAALVIMPYETVFLNLGAAFWNKGVDVLIHAFALLRQHHPSIRLILKDQRALYSATTADAAVRQLAGEHPSLFPAATLDAISLVGSNLSQQQLRSLYCVADCYVSPYRAEGFNLPVL